MNSATPTQPTKSFWLTAGIIAVLLGIHAMQEPQPILIMPAFLAFSNNLNSLFHIEIINLPNVLLGLPAILIGAWVFIKAIDLSDWEKFELTTRLPELPAIQWKYVLPRLLGALALFGLLLLQLSQHAYASISIAFWLIPILAITLLFWRRERDNASDLPLHIHWIDWLLMLLLFCAAIASGAFLLRDLAPWLIPDEGAFWELTRAIAIQQYRPAFFDFGVYSFPIASSVFQGWIARWAGVDLWGWRFASVLAGSATIFPLYLLAHELFDRRVAVLTCVLMMVNPYYITFARLGYNNSQALFPVVLAVYFMVIALRRGSYFYWWLAGLTAGLGYYTYFAAWLGVVIIVISVMALPIVAKIPLRKTVLIFLTVMSAWLMMALPRIVYGISSETDHSLYYKMAETSFVSGFYGRAIFGEEVINHVPHWRIGPEGSSIEAFYNPELYGILWVRGILRSLAILFDGTLYKDHFIVTSLLGPGTTLFFVVGLASMLTRLRKNAAHFILNVWFWLGLIGLSMLAAFPPRPTHSVALIPILALFSALGLVLLVELLIKEIPLFTARFKLAQTGMIVLTLLIVATLGLSTYFVKMPAQHGLSYDYSVSWIARNITTPVTIIFVDENITAHDAAYQAQTLLTGHTILAMPRFDINTIPDTVRGQYFLAFINAENGGEQTALQVGALVPKSKVRIITDSKGGTRGFVVSNISVATKMDLSFAHGLSDLWTSPAGSLILACLLLTLFIALYQLKKYPTAWEGTSLVVRRTDSETNLAETHIHSPGIELDFHLRIHLPQRRRPVSTPEPQSAPPPAPKKLSPRKK